MKYRLHPYLFVFTIFFYLGAQIGLPAFKHYCGGELESISLFVKGEQCCGDEEEAPSEDDGCCQDKLDVAQHHSHSILSKTASLPSVSEFSVLFVPVLSFVSFLPPVPSSLLYAPDHPPLRVQHDLVKTSVLRI
ncbi:MAG: hypothetical protein QM534_05570 [Sediminibacterium sp.]|nr:hypothetical protein [Sediminibacterium sp.]